jgi:Bifunctional DNA primase/polymerase, N-terminal/Primase C terminal 1 (PriCT-1)
LPLAARNIPVMPLRSKEKIAFLPDWTNKATTDPTQIEQWGVQFPDSNCASVAKANLGAVWFFEIDSPEARQRLESETGQKIPKTFSVRSSPGRGHFYWKHTPASLAMGNISQGVVKQGDWSARTHNEYVVSPGSIHPSGKAYEVVSDSEIVECPDWLVQWCVSQKLTEKEAKQQTEEFEIISEGSRNVRLTSIAGKLRYDGLCYEEIKGALGRINRERCRPPMSDADVDTISKSVSRYETGENDVPLIGGVPAGMSVGASQLPVNQAEVNQKIEEAIKGRIVIPYPNFPDWVMNGTSLYEGLVKPVCDKNSRYPEFMFMPAMVMMMNYLGGRVRISEKGWPNSFYLLCIGRKGRVIKSASAEDAINYFIDAGVAGYAGRSVKNAEGKTMVWQAGSTEGFGKDMQRINCANAVLFYDEFSAMVAKASIESSSMIAHLTTLYESGHFQNMIKASKDTFDFAPNTYTASLIACTTDKNFHELWNKMRGTTSGLDERFFFLYQPEKFKPTSPMKVVPTFEGAQRTRKIIDRAIQQATFNIFDDSPLAKRTNEETTSRDKLMSNRLEIHAEKFALYFAVDLGLDEIDDVCIDRGLALADYEMKAKRYLRVDEVYTKEAGVQSEIENFLIRHDKPIEATELARHLHASRYGTTLWTNSLSGLIKTDAILVVGSGVRGDPRKLVWNRQPDIDD